MTGARMKRANVQFASRCVGETLIRPRHCATFHGRCATTRPNRRCVGATAREPHADALRAHAKTGAR
eukprot:1177387-Lingulodinium_polyedra.AAC.1